MPHPYFDYCDSHDRRRQLPLPKRRARRTDFFAKSKAILSNTYACIFARRLPT